MIIFIRKTQNKKNKKFIFFFNQKFIVSNSSIFSNLRIIMKNEIKITN